MGLASQTMINQSCYSLGPDHMSVMQKREVSLIQMSGKYMHISMVDRLGPSMAICITLIWRAILK